MEVAEKPLNRCLEHKDGKKPDPPNIHLVDVSVNGGVAIMADGPMPGDILIISRTFQMSDYNWVDLNKSKVKDFTTFLYYLVAASSKPPGVCHGHSMFTLKELRE